MAEGVGEDEKKTQVSDTNSSNTAHPTENGNSSMEKAAEANGKENGDLKDVISESPSSEGSDDGKKGCCRIEYFYLVLTIVLGAGLLGVMLYFTIANTIAKVLNPETTQTGSTINQNAFNDLQTTGGIPTTTNAPTTTILQSALTNRQGQVGGTKIGESSSGTTLGRNSFTISAAGTNVGKTQPGTKIENPPISTSVPLTSTSGPPTKTSAPPTTTSAPSTTTKKSLFLPGGGIPKEFLRGGLVRG